ncbi:MAG: glutathione S-transferase family protein [Myxococcales bacterium]|nr:glutathione S-transferase family protein [Myxococcales bacterium]
MITLYRFAPAWDVPDISPFCVKVETFLRLTKTEFVAKLGDPRKAPKGKLPYVDHDGTVIADSSAIVAHFNARLGDPLDQGLDTRDRAIAEAFRGMIEESLYFALLYERWSDPAGWRLLGPVFEGILGQAGVPSLLRGFVAERVRKKMIGILDAQGTGRHTKAEIDALAKKQVDAIADWLGGSTWFLGEAPRSIDATVYAFVQSILGAHLDSAIQAHTRGHQNLVAYVERIQAGYFVT